MLIEGVTNGDIVPNEVPPEGVLYQFKVVPVLPVACKETVPVPHRLAEVVAVILFVKVI